MAKKKKEEVVEETPKVNEPKGDVTKVTTKMKKPAEDLKTVTKVDLTKKPEETNETKEEVTNDSTDDSRVVEIVEDAGATQEQEEVQPEVETQETPVVEEVTNEEKVTEVIEQTIAESIETGKDLPENIQKLMDFMDDTGGDLSDYLKLNQDYSELDNHALLKEYYKSTRPHLSEEEVEFVMEDTFAFDENVDDDKEIKRKKLAMKEQVASAKQHLESVKSKYYEDIKAGSKLTEEQQKAMDYFNEYNKRSATNQKMSDIFRTKTEAVFNEQFKGFEYKVGDKKFRFNIKDADKVKTTQSDINNFIGKFLNKEEAMEDATGYHKGLFTAMNPDQIANHFYEQGRADALKDSIAKSKNVSMDPRQSHVENVNTSGFKARVLNDDGPDFKFKIKTKK
tara:strand:+ start:4321 stop:5505 length:1185 start_codon:yes stop_codon:yes gene_type:complete